MSSDELHYYEHIIGQVDLSPFCSDNPDELSDDGFFELMTISNKHGLAGWEFVSIDRDDEDHPTVNMQFRRVIPRERAMKLMSSQRADLRVPDDFMQEIDSWDITTIKLDKCIHCGAMHEYKKDSPYCLRCAPAIKYPERNVG